MKQTILTLVFTLLLSAALLAQGDECNCLENFNTLVAKTEENYAGFPDKITNENYAVYSQQVEAIRRKTVTEENPRACYFLLKEYIRLFKDKHFMLSYDPGKYADREIMPISENSFRQHLQTGKVTAIEGIWITADSSLKIAVIRDAAVFKGVVLESSDPAIEKGLVYYTFTPDKNGFIVNEYNSFLTTDVPARQKGNLLQIWNQQMFGKISPGELTANEKAELSTWKNNNNGLAFKKLSSKTSYLKVPTFRNNDDKIRELILQHDSILRQPDCGFNRQRWWQHRLGFLFAIFYDQPYCSISIVCKS